MTTVTGEQAADDRDPESNFYRQVLQTLEAADVPVLVGGAYALAHYTGIERRKSRSTSSPVSESATFFGSSRPVTLFASGPLLMYQL